MNSESRNMIFYGIILGVVAGGLCGGIIGEPMTSIGFIGDFFINALKMIVVPLVVASIIVGITSLGNITKIGRIGLLTIGFYLTTTIIAVVIGIIMVSSMNPGAKFEKPEKDPVLSDAAQQKLTHTKDKSSSDVLKDLLLSFAPQNIIKAAAETQILGLIVFSLIFGGILTTLGARGQPVIDFFVGFNEAMIKMVHLIMYLAPIGIFALVAKELGAAGGGAAFWVVLSRLGWYASTVIIGLLIHAFIVLPLILWVFGKKSPLQFALGMGPALLNAFSTASSSATLPITMECITERNTVRKEVSDFVLPLGATINMDGTALYEAVAAIFIGTVFVAGFDPGMGELIVIAVTATLASIGAAGIPNAGLFTMVIVFTALGFPEKAILAGLATILVIDWFLDRCRTTVNVWGDSCVTASIDRLTSKEHA